MKQLNKIKKILIAILCIVLLLALLMRINILPSLGNIFYRQPLMIDDTKILIKEIRPLAQLTTITAYDEVVMDSVKYKKPGLTDKLLHMAMPVPVNSNYDELVIIARGRVIAGSDLNNLATNDVFVQKDSASLILPIATVLDVIINPSDFETFSEKGDWESEEVSFVKESARNIIKNRALRQGILEKANLQAVITMRNFLLALGFKKINVTVKSA
jgi:Protein of unknown function (DUF4230)